MASPVYISGAVEGPADEPVLRRIVEGRGAHVHRVQVQRGKANVRRALPGYNRNARWSPWFVMVDLDQDFDCAAAMVSDWLPAPAQYMRFRVVVRQVEAWLLADADHFSKWFAVSKGTIPEEPDRLPDAKATLIQLVATSRRLAVRQDMTPRLGSGRRVGPAYTSRIVEFASDPIDGWRSEVAATRSPGLAKCLRRLDELVAAPPR